jgi:hypothetical protein
MKNEMKLDNLEPPPDGGELDLATEKLMKKLLPLGPAYPLNIIRRASTLGDVAEILIREKPTGLVQIVGHGLPGVLKLGSGWTVPAGSGAIYRIDADINRYGLLKGRICSSKQVRLLGCETGKEADDTVEDGPTLIFTFARLWRAEVAAPDVSFNECDFDEHGIFASTHKLVVAMPSGEVRGTEARVPQPHPTARSEYAGRPELIRFNKLMDAPMFERALRSIPLPSPKKELMEQLSQSRFELLPPEGLFAAAEFVFDVEWQREPWTCDVLVRQSLLRLRRDGSQPLLLRPMLDGKAAHHLSELVTDLRAGLGGL